MIDLAIQVIWAFSKVQIQKILKSDIRKPQIKNWFKDQNKISL